MTKKEKQEIREDILNLQKRLSFIQGYLERCTDLEA